MGTLCRVSHIGCPCQYQSMEILINSLHPNNAIQLTLFINQCIQYDYHPVWTVRSVRGAEYPLTNQANVEIVNFLIL